MWQGETRQILGTPSETSWSQVHHFLAREKKKFEKKGELILLVSLGKVTPEQEISALGREIISRFHEEYFGTLEKKPMASLKEALIKVGQEKSRYFEGPKEISLLALVIWKKVGYLGIWHQGKVLLRRQGKTVAILEGQGDQVKVASGLLEKDDLLFLATNSFFENLPQGMISASLSTEDLETITEVLTPVIHAREKQGNLAAVLVRISDQPVALPEEEKKTGKEKVFLKKGKEFFLKRLRKTGVFKKIGLFLKNIFKNLGPKTSSLTVAVGFFLLLSFSIFFGWQKRAKQRKLAEISRLSVSIEEKLEAAGAIKNLDPENSLRLVNETGEIINHLRELDSGRADSFQARVDSLSSGLGGEAVEPELYYDFNLISEGFETKNSSAEGQKTIFLGNKKLISLNLEKKSGEIIAGGEELEGKNLVVFTNDKVYLINEKIDQLKREGLEKTADLEEGSQIVSAGGWLGNVYLLDKANKQIWKHPGLADGLGKAGAWLKSDPSFDFDSAVDIDIDGHIWVLTDRGRIYKFLSGREDNFNQQLPSGVGRAKFLALAQEEEILAFWDEEKKIVWVFNKKGEFQSRIPLKLDQVDELIVSPDGKKIYLFSKDKVYLLKLI